MSLRAIFAYFFLFFVTITPSSGTETSHLTKVDQQLSLVLSILDRHPELMGSLIAHGGNPANLLEFSENFNGNPAAQFQIPFSKPHYLSLGAYSNLTAFTYDPEGLSAVQNKLLAEADKLSLDLNKDLYLSSFTRDLPKMALMGEKTLKSFLLLSPILYNSVGETQIKNLGNGIDPIKNYIQSLSGAQIEVLYYLNFTNYFLPFAKSLDITVKLKISDLLNSINNQFVNKFLRSHLRAVKSSTKGKKKITMSLEEVPPLVALFRGAIGYDCSCNSVAYYALHKDVKVFWIRKNLSLESPVKGYLLVTEAEYNGRKLPYILTVNGNNLNSEHMRLAILSMAQHYQSNELLVAQQEFFANTPAARHALYMYDSQVQKVRVKMPNSWTEFSMPNRVELQQDYYRPELSESANLVKLNDEERDLTSQTQQQTIEQQYQVAQSISDKPLFDRTLLGAYFVRTLEQKDWPAIAKKLDVTEEALRLAKELSDSFKVLGRTSLDDLYAYCHLVGLSGFKLINKFPVYYQVKILDQQRNHRNSSVQQLENYLVLFPLKEELRWAIKSYRAIYNDLSHALIMQDRDVIQHLVEQLAKLFDDRIDPNYKYRNALYKKLKNFNNPILEVSLFRTADSWGKFNHTYFWDPLIKKLKSPQSTDRLFAIEILYYYRNKSEKKWPAEILQLLKEEFQKNEPPTIKEIIKLVSGQDDLIKKFDRLIRGKIYQHYNSEDIEMRQAIVKYISEFIDKRQEYRLQALDKEIIEDGISSDNKEIQSLALKQLNRFTRSWSPSLNENILNAISPSNQNFLQKNLYSITSIKYWPDHFNLQTLIQRLEKLINSDQSDSFIKEAAKRALISVGPHYFNRTGADFWSAIIKTLEGNNRLLKRMALDTLFKRRFDKIDPIYRLVYENGRHKYLKNWPEDVFVLLLQIYKGEDLELRHDLLQLFSNLNNVDAQTLEILKPLLVESFENEDIELKALVLDFLRRVVRDHLSHKEAKIIIQGLRYNNTWVQTNALYCLEWLPLNLWSPDMHGAVLDSLDTKKTNRVQSNLHAIKKIKTWPLSFDIQPIIDQVRILTEDQDNRNIVNYAKEVLAMLIKEKQARVTRLRCQKLFH